MNGLIKVKLGDVTEIARGSSPRPIKDQSYFDGGIIPWVKIADATKSNKYIYKTKQHVNDYGASFSRKLPKGSLIVAASGTLGFAIFLGVEGCVHDGWLYFKYIDETKLDINYLYFLLNTLTKSFNAVSYGAAIQNINTKILRETEIPLPALSTQKKIAAILSAYDDLIENNKRRIALLESMAEEIYREWFVRFRFPGYQAAKFKKGFPKEWVTKTFREIVSYYIGGGWGEEDRTTSSSEGAYVIRGTDIPPLANGNYSNKVYRYHKASNLKSRKIQENDFVFEVSGGSKDQLLGRNLMVSKGLLSLFEGEVMCASFCKQIRFNKELVSPYFMKYYLKLYYECDLVGIYQVQSTGISNYQFESFLNYQTLLIPDEGLLERFDEAVRPIIEQQEKLALSNLNLEKTKTSLLLRLISGKLSVTDLNIQFPPSMQDDEAA